MEYHYNSRFIIVSANSSIFSFSFLELAFLFTFDAFFPVLFLSVMFYFNWIIDIIIQ
jgi:hypothetical protein